MAAGMINAPNFGLANTTKPMPTTARPMKPPREPVPRLVDGNDTAWLVLEGEYRGMLLYPEALALTQQGFTRLEAPDGPTHAMALTRAQIARACGEDPAAGVKLMQNLARLLAGDLRDSQRQ